MTTDEYLCVNAYNVHHAECYSNMYSSSMTDSESSKIFYVKGWRRNVLGWERDEEDEIAVWPFRNTENFSLDIHVHVHVTLQGHVDNI